MIELQQRQVVRSLNKRRNKKEGCDLKINGGVLRQNDLGKKKTADNCIINNSELLKKPLASCKAQKQCCECSKPSYHLKILERNHTR